MNTFVDEIKERHINATIPNPIVFNDIQIAYRKVDMGLSVYWADMNFGATTPEERGNYYAWGELNAKERYNLINYKWYDGNGMQKYSEYDGQYQLGREDDVVQF